MKKCCICGAEVEREDAPVLVMSISGNPKLLCDDCAASLDVITLGKDFYAISDEMDKIGKRMSENDLDDVTYETMNRLLANAAVRAKLIDEGKYDFARDEMEDDDDFDEIPEELQETEEDRQKDEEDKEKMRKFDRIFNITALTVIIITIGIVAWKLVESYIFK